MIEKMVHISQLYDFYGALLTERQRQCLDLHYLQDMSLGEIAANFGVSRQAVNDILRRSEEALESYERILGLMEQEREKTNVLQAVRALLAEALPLEIEAQGPLHRAADIMDGILKREMGY
jgi:uncharacterized protein